MTLIVPTAYRRNGWREHNRLKMEQAGDAQEVILKCLRCFQPATRGQRCDGCRAKRETGNMGRKR